MGLGIALSGLGAQQKALEVISHNVANISTVGFKASDTEFADVYARAVSGGNASSDGLGVMVSQVSQRFTMGSLRTTSRPLDIAINGRGFFRMEQPDGTVSYTRNGEFHVDKDGYVVNAQNYKVTGYKSDTGQVPPQILVGTLPIPMQMDQSDMPPKMTTFMDMQFNLNSNSKLLGAAQKSVNSDKIFSTKDSTSYNYATSSTVYDSLGNTHNVGYYFRRVNIDTVSTAPTGFEQPLSKWQVFMNMDGQLMTSTMSDTMGIDKNEHVYQSINGAYYSASGERYVYDATASSWVYGRHNLDLQESDPNSVTRVGKDASGLYYQIRSFNEWPVQSGRLPTGATASPTLADFENWAPTDSQPYANTTPTLLRDTLGADYAFVAGTTNTYRSQTNISNYNYGGIDKDNNLYFYNGDATSATSDIKDGVVQNYYDYNGNSYRRNSDGYYQLTTAKLSDTTAAKASAPWVDGAPQLALTQTQLGYRDVSGVSGATPLTMSVPITLYRRSGVNYVDTLNKTYYQSTDIKFDPANREYWKYEIDSTDNKSKWFKYMQTTGGATPTTAADINSFGTWVKDTTATALDPTVTADATTIATFKSAYLSDINANTVAGSISTNVSQVPDQYQKNYVGGFKAVGYSGLDAYGNKTYSDDKGWVYTYNATNSTYYYGGSYVDIFGTLPTAYVEMTFDGNGKLASLGNGTPDMTSGNKIINVKNNDSSGFSFDLSMTSIRLQEVGATKITRTGPPPQMTIKMNFTGATQYSSSSSPTYAKQDGYAPGKLNDYRVEKDGQILGVYNNGLTRTLGQMVVSTFVNPNGLQPTGDNQWLETRASGGPMTTTPGTSSTGILQSNTVEDSNVDLTKEMVNMISTQRAYQSNAQSIKTQDAMWQSVMNIR